jgi:hypothetical protein
MIIPKLDKSDYPFHVKGKRKNITDGPFADFSCITDLVNEKEVRSLPEPLDYYHPELVLTAIQINFLKQL